MINKWNAKRSTKIKIYLFKQGLKNWERTIKLKKFIIILYTLTLEYSVMEKKRSLNAIKIIKKYLSSFSQFKLKFIKWLQAMKSTPKKQKKKRKKKIRLKKNKRYFQKHLKKFKKFTSFFIYFYGIWTFFWLLFG